MTDPDVVVIGGGPAGMAAAIVCATHGLRTLLVERQAFPVAKACGEGLLPNGVAALERIGVDGRALAALGEALQGIRYFTPWGRTACGSFDGRPAFGIRRADLSRVLIEQARRLPGLDVVTGHAALVPGSRTPMVRIGGNTCRPKLVIGADGLHSRTRDVMGIAAGRGGRHRWGCRQHFEGKPWSDRIEVYFRPGFECYVTPVAGGLNVALLWDERLAPNPRGASPISLIKGIPTLAGRLEALRPSDRPRGAGPFDLRVRRPWRTGVLLMGDAAGYVDPLTGEGVGLAIEQASLLSSTVIPELHRVPDGDVVGSNVLESFWRAAFSMSRPNRQLTRLLLRFASQPPLVERLVALLASDRELFADLLNLNMGRGKVWQVPMRALMRWLFCWTRPIGAREEVVQ